jgi:hypothetical protein
MRLNRSVAIYIEKIVRRAVSEDYKTYGGLISADYFEYNPIAAAAICIYALYSDDAIGYISDFLLEWKCADEDKFNTEYTRQLSELVDYLWNELKKQN